MSRRMQRDSIKRGYGRADADGGWRMGFKKKKRKKKIARMLILLNFFG